MAQVSGSNGQCPLVVRNIVREGWDAQKKVFLERPGQVGLLVIWPLGMPGSLSPFTAAVKAMNGAAAGVVLMSSMDPEIAATDSTIGAKVKPSDGAFVVVHGDQLEVLDLPSTPFAWKSVVAQSLRAVRPTGVG